MSYQASSSETAASKPNVVGRILCLSVFFYIVAILISASDRNNSEYVLAFVCLATVTSIFGIAVLIEQKFLLHVRSYAVSAVLWVLVLGVAGYFASGKAISDINGVFPFDANALPKTLSAGVAIHLLLFMFWPLVVSTICGGIFLFFAWRDEQFPVRDEAQRNVAIRTAVMICVTAGIGAMFLNQFFSDTKRAHILYRVAHTMDFSSNFSCAGIDPKASHVLFVGPDQLRISVAPIIPETIFYFGPRVAEIMQEVTLPAKDVLELQDCLPRSAGSTDPVEVRLNELNFEMKPIEQ